MAQKHPGEGPASRETGGGKRESARGATPASRRPDPKAAPSSSPAKKSARAGRASTRTGKADRAADEISSSDSEMRVGGGALVLVVDDYQDAREMCCEYLSYCGFRVAEARNGQEAIAKATELLPDLILMDLSLPGMDGWEATRRLKADEKTKAIPVVALTGHALAGHSEGARDAGCDAFVTKPCMPDQLVAEVKRVLAGPQPRPRSKKGS
jgi:CheY-like chemotaxis protein